MLQVVLHFTLMIAVVSGPLACCCTLTPAPGRSAEGCCCHSSAPTPSERGTPKEHCPCKQKEPRALDTLSATAHLERTLLERQVVSLLDAVPHVPGLPSASLEPFDGRHHCRWFLTSGEMLRALHILLL